VESNKSVHTLCSEKTPTYIFFYISHSNAQIYTTITVNVTEERWMSPMQNLVPSLKLMMLLWRYGISLLIWSAWNPTTTSF